MIPVNSAGRTSVGVGVVGLELVDGFCCLGDMLGVDGMLVQLWRMGSSLDVVSCLPIMIYH